MRSLIDWCLHRPVAVTALGLMVTGLAALAYARLPVALLPELRYPALAVWTAYPDVPPERVERAVTEPVETAVAGAEGLTSVTGRSLMGGSLVALRFGWNTDLDVAQLNVREQLDRLGDALPEEAERPVVLRIDPSERPVMLLAMRGRAAPGAVRRAREKEGTDAAGGPDLVSLKRLARAVVARRLEQLEGVARVRVTGGFDPEVEVRLDPERLARYRLTVGQVAGALRAANVTLPGGLIRRGPFRYAVEVSGAFTSADDVRLTIVGYAGKTPLRLADVATVRADVAERRGLVRFQGDEALLLLVERTADANTVATAGQVREALRLLEAETPGIRLDVVVDESRFIRQAIDGVRVAVMLGGALALLVLLLFLRRIRVLLAVAVTVPLSLALALIGFEWAGISLNLISLSGLALGVGMLVDNAIVVTENIARLREQGRSALEAARDGAAEVAGAVTASTLTTIAVFGPLALVEGLAGRLFRDQALAVVFALLASLLVALTVAPVLAGRDPRPGAARRSGGRGVAVYERLLRWALRRRGRVLAGCGLLMALAGGLAWHLPRRVTPPTAHARLTMRLAAPPGADLPQVSRWAAALEAEALRTPGVSGVLADLGERDEARLDLDPRPAYEGVLTVALADTAQAERVLARLARAPVPPALTVEVRPERSRLEQLLTPGEAELWLDMHADRRADAEAAAGAALARLRQSPALINVRRAYAQEAPAYALSFRRDRLARFGLEAGRLAELLAASARGVKATALQRVNEDVPIRLRLPGPGSVKDLLRTEIPTAEGLKPLSLFVEATPVSLPVSLLRADQAPVVRLLADAAPGADLAEARAALEAVVSEGLPPGVRASLGGATDAFDEGVRAAGWSLLLSLFLVYLILAAQFESLIQPLVILMTVPLAAAGVVLALAVTGQSVNLMSLTGMVVLVGIVVNDAIIKVDFINRRRAEGMALEAAIEAAGRDRVRPILMTTITTVLGLLPLALGVGPGAALQQPLALTVIGGLASATLLTLIVVPVLYTFTVRLSRLRRP